MDPRIDTNQILSQVTSEAPIGNKGEDPDKLKELAEQFEAIFVQQMYQEMRKTIPDNGLIERSNADDIYQQLQDREAARITVGQGGIGLAELMMRQMMEE